MKNNLSDYVNTKRRKTLGKYTLLALIVYTVPISSSYIAKYIGIENIRHSDATSYLLITTLCLYTAVFIAIYIKKQITIRFIYTLLYLQVMIALCQVTGFFYVLQDFRILMLLVSLLFSIFVFIQSSLTVSFSLVSLVAVDYLAVSYIAIVRMGQPGNFQREMLISMVYLPVSFFLGYMCSIVQKQHKELKASRNELKKTYTELESYHERMLESIQYAELIQRSLLPGIDRMKTQTADSMIIWMPKDIVGGDIFYTCTLPGKTIIALMDCTGHGVPGAFLTMIAYTEIRKIILDQECHVPGEILKRLNMSMKNALHKNSDKQLINDGLDAGVICMDHLNKTIIFSGARIPLFFVENGIVTQVKGDKASIGYRDSNTDHEFSNHTIIFKSEGRIYIKTDGFTDQLGGPKRQRFGTRKFEEMIQRIHEQPFDVQREELLKAFSDHQGAGNDQIDDVTVIGFRI